jgi:ERCC4-related helicase
LIVIVIFFPDRHLPIIMKLRHDVSGGTSSYRLSPSETVQRLKDFSSGVCNLLLSTSVSEEGLDICAANYVLRFDAVQTPVSLVQSRGRARAQKSHFAVLSESVAQPLTRIESAERTHDEIVDSIAFGGDPRGIVPGAVERSYRHL